MNEQNVDPHLAKLAADYAKAAQAASGCEVDNTDPDNGFQFTADGYHIQVYRVEPNPDVEPPNDWFEWRIKKDGITVAENADDDHAIFSDSAMAEAWLIFTRLLRTNETDESDDEAEVLYEAARNAVRAAWRVEPKP
jgi:hypothetical protein